MHAGKISTIGTLLLSLFILLNSCFAKYSGGSGTAGDPYQIANTADLLALAADSDDYDDCFILINDINLADYNFIEAVLSLTYFKGTFDGNDHVISNVTIIGDTTAGNIFTGFFRNITASGIVKNLGLENINVIGSMETLGDFYVGSLAGRFTSGTITGCYATGTVTGRMWIGGLVGYCSSSTAITNCYTNVMVSGLSRVGGLVGYDEGNITNCYSTGAVGSSNTNAGGLVGEKYYGDIVGCYATGPVTGNNLVGGLVGKNFGGFIINCYAAGSVSGVEKVGGLVGENSYGSINGCFWDINTSGQMTSAGGTGKTTAQMQDANTYIDAGWAYHNWVINEGVDYPHLAWENTGGIPIPEPSPIPLAGSGSEQDPYQVWTAEDFAMLSQHTSVLNKHISLMADVNLSGTALNPIGDLGHFTGVFEGNGHTISSAAINIPDRSLVGLFSRSNGQIYNLGLKAVEMSGYGYIGSLVGYNYGGIITNCCSEEVVNGYSHVGGLIGRNAGSITDCYSTGVVNVSYSYAGGVVGSNGGSITGCHSSGMVSGDQFVGGLAGTNYGSMTDCYSGGTVIGDQLVGGLSGLNDGIITNCHSTGAVSGNGEVGGLCGSLYFSSITSCYSSGSVSGSQTVGGLVGWNWEGNINNCYSTSAVTGEYSTGGLVGGNDGSITNCYSNGAIRGHHYVGGLVGSHEYGNITDCYSFGTVDGNDLVGGLIGDCYDQNDVNDSFWDIETSGLTISDGGEGKTTAQMQDINTFLIAGWDFIETWGIEDNQTYPFLRLSYPVGDLDLDKKVNLIDFAFLANHWLEGVE